MASSPEMKPKTHITSIALGVLFSVCMTPLAAHAQDKIVRVQTLQDAWQVRRAETRAFITAIGNEKVTQAQQASALSGFDSRLTAAEKGELTPIETMEMFQVFYIPKELQKKPPRFDMLLRIVAAQATMPCASQTTVAGPRSRTTRPFLRSPLTRALPTLSSS